jgi:hypothetical protein
MGSSLRTSSQLACGAAVAVAPGQYPEITTRWLTRPRWRRAN